MDLGKGILKHLNEDENPYIEDKEWESRVDSARSCDICGEPLDGYEDDEIFYLDDGRVVCPACYDEIEKNESETDDEYVRANGPVDDEVFDISKVDPRVLDQIGSNDPEVVENWIKDNGGLEEYENPRPNETYIRNIIEDGLMSEADILDVILKYLPDDEIGRITDEINKIPADDSEDE